jgi:hypothetical protein
VSFTVGAFAACAAHYGASVFSFPPEILYLARGTSVRHCLMASSAVDRRYICG